jgi:hypothetical protein
LSKGGINVPPSPPPELNAISEVSTLEMVRPCRPEPVRNVDDAEVAKHPGYVSYTEMVEGRPTTVWKGKGKATLIFNPDFATPPTSPTPPSLPELSYPQAGTLAVPIVIPSHSPLPAIPPVSVKARALIEDSLNSVSHPNLDKIGRDKVVESINRAKRIETMVRDIVVKAMSGAEWMLMFEKYVLVAHCELEEHIKAISTTMVGHFAAQASMAHYKQQEDHLYLTNKLYWLIEPLICSVSHHGFTASSELKTLNLHMIDQRRELDDANDKMRELFVEEIQVCLFFSYCFF